MNRSELLRRAWSEVQAADLPQEMQAVAFSELVKHMLGGDPPAGSSRTSDSTRSEEAGTASDAGRADTQGPTEADIYRRIAKHTEVNEEKLAQVLYLDEDGELRVAIPGSRLGKNNADRTRAVAQLLTVGRAFGFGEDGTSFSAIRSECSRLKIYDPTNYSTYVTKVTGYIVSGSGANRKLRIRSGGVEAFNRLIDQLTGSLA